MVVHVFYMLQMLHLSVWMVIPTRSLGGQWNTPDPFLGSANQNAVCNSDFSNCSWIVYGSTLVSYGNQFTFKHWSCSVVNHLSTGAMKPSNSEKGPGTAVKFPHISPMLWVAENSTMVITLKNFAPEGSREAFAWNAQTDSLWTNRQIWSGRKNMAIVLKSGRMRALLPTQDPGCLI